MLVDNCEHVLGSVAELVPFLQRERAGLVVVATSREPIGLGAERLYRVGPLAVDGGDGSGTTGRGPAVELFLQRARDGGATLDDDGATLATVTKICRDLDRPAARDPARRRPGAVDVDHGPEQAPG